MLRRKILACAIAAASALSVASIGHAGVIAPGQCKKQGPHDCNGNSECAPPHAAQLPNGQQKKC